MAVLDISAASTTDLDNTVKDFSVADVALDKVGPDGETYWYFTNAKTNLGYLKSIPEYWSSLKAMALWVAGKGYETDAPTKIELEHVAGAGKDSILSILQGMIIVKKAIGDAFAQIIKEGDSLINLKPISPERVRIVYNPNGLIKRYDLRKRSGEWQAIPKEEMFHLINDRIADETHGTDTISVCKWVIDSRNEALADERKIKHRELALGVLYIDEDNPTKRKEIEDKYGEAVKNGEVLVLPKDTAELKDSGVNPKERLEWIRYLEGFFYQTSGVPRVMVNSEGFAEAGGKVGYLTFELVYTSEQLLLELDIWNQLFKKIKFNRPASLGGTVQQDEAKNTGQLGFQPKDTEATIERE